MSRIVKTPRREEKFILTPREENVMMEVLSGHSSKEIAQHLGITEGGVESHRTSIIKKMDSPERPCRNMFQAIGLFFHL